MARLHLVSYCSKVNCPATRQGGVGGGGGEMGIAPTHS
jgi:hypothetical protein